MLVTDRPNPKSTISDALQVIAAVEVVGPDEAWDRRGAIAGVVCDLTLARPQAVRCLRRLQARYAGVEPPLLCLLRQVTSESILEAKALGAVACFSVDAPPRNIMQALLKIIYPTESIADRLIQASAERTGEILGALFRAAHEGLAPTMALVEPALDPVLDAMAAGGLSRWLDTVRAYDDGTYQHCLLVAGFAANFAQHLRFPRFDQRRVMRAALVHDVGKAKIPRAILNKPGQLDEDELEVMRTHATLGFQLLKDGGECDQATLDAVRHHHEMLDGSGYPDGLRGSEISDLVRLLTICDIYAALTERRPYKPPLPTDSKLRILAEMRDKLDPDLVPAFGDSVRGTGERCLVIVIGKVAPALSRGVSLMPARDGRVL